MSDLKSLLLELKGEAAAFNARLNGSDDAIVSLEGKLREIGIACEFTYKERTFWIRWSKPKDSPQFKIMVRRVMKGPQGGWKEIGNASLGLRIKCIDAFPRFLREFIMEIKQVVS